MALTAVEVLDDAHARALRDRSEAERRLADAVRAAQRLLDTVMDPAEFDARGFASAAVAVLESEAAWKAAAARCAELRDLRLKLA